MSRQEEMKFLFSNTIEVFESAFLPWLRLSEEETATFEECVFAWFDRYTRRPGNEYAPIERFQIPLLSGACQIARDFGEGKGVSVPSLAANPTDVARRLGLLQDSEPGTPEQ